MMASRKAVLMTGGLALAGFAAAFVMAQPSDGVGLLSPDDAEVVALGQGIYVAQCAACHGTKRCARNCVPFRGTI